MNKKMIKYKYARINMYVLVFLNLWYKLMFTVSSFFILIHNFLKSGFLGFVVFILEWN